MKMTGIYFKILVYLLALVLIVACGFAQGEVGTATEYVGSTIDLGIHQVLITPTPAPTKPEAKTILRVATGDGGEGLVPHQMIIADFERENPDILVQLEPVSGGDYYTRLQAQISANNAADILQVGDDALPMFVDQAALVPLDGLIKGQYPLDTNMYFPGTLSPGQYKNQQWLLPKDFSPLGVYYNRKIFDKYNVPYPKDGWTWSDLLATAKKLTLDEDGDGKPEIWGLQLPGAWTSGFEYWVGAAGGWLVSPDGKNYVGYMDSPETISAVQFYADLYNKYKVAPPPTDLSLFGGGNMEFDYGEAAMRLFGRWPQSNYRDNPNIDLGVVTPPVGLKPANVLFWAGFGIFSGSRHPEAAWRFLRYYVGEEGSKIWVNWGIPPVAKVAEKAGLTRDPIEGEWIKGLGLLVDRSYIATPYWSEDGDPALRKALEIMLTDPTADVAKVMHTAAVEAQTALDARFK